MINFLKKRVLTLLVVFVAQSGIINAQIPIDCNKFYLHDPPNIYSYNIATSTSALNPIACPASGIGLAVSNNLNSGSPAVTFYTTVSGQYWYYNGATWVNTGHSCSSSAAVNLCGAGPYVYNLDGLNSRVYRYNGSGTDVLVLALTNWDGPYDLIGDDNGNFYVLYTNAGFQKLAKYSPAGAILCTYNLVGMPASSSGAGYAIVGTKIYVSGGAGNFVGNIVGTTITFSGMGAFPGLTGDFASCPFPQLSSNINSTGNLSCTTLSSILTATTTVTGPSYSWSGPGIVSGGGTNVVTVNQGGTYTVVITGSGGACPGASTSTINISQSGTPPVVTASSSGAVTCSNLSVNLSSSPSGLSYTWTAPGGSSITSGTNSQNATGSGGGTYTVTASSGGCTTSTVVNVASNTTPPTASSSSGGVLTCATTNVNLSGGPGSGVSYSWSGPGIIAGGTSASPTVNQPGTYNLTVTDLSNGCTGSSSTFVSQNITPPSATAATAAGNVLNCNVTSLSLSGSPSSGVSYSWSGPGIISGGNTSSPTVNQPGTYYLIVTDGSNGCSNSSSPASVVITQDVTPPSASAAAASGNVLNCSITSLNLTGSPSSGVSYSWSGPGITAGGNTSSPTVNQPGTYSLVVTNSSNGCSNASSPAVVTITQNVITINGSASTGSVITCASTSVDLNASPAGYSYSWIAPGGSSINTGSTSQNATGTGGGTYTVTITDVSTGCSNNATVVIPQDIAPPSGVTASASGSLTCSVATLTLSSTPGSGVTYNWSGPGIVSGATTANPVVNQAGVYTLIVTNNSNGCSNASAPASVNVLSNGAIPVASASATGSITCSSTSLTINGNPDANATYSWAGPGIVSGGTTTTPVIDQPGSYVFVVTNTVSGCSNSTTVTVSQNISIPLPVILAVGNETLTCNITAITLTVTPSTGVSYNWSGPGITSGGNTANPTVNLPGTYSVVVTDNASGCSNAVPVTATIFQNTVVPTVLVSTAVGSSSITCAVPTATLNALPATGVTYIWSGPGITSGATTANPTVNQPGNYSVTVTDNVSGCSNVLGIAGSVVNVPLDNAAPIAQINAATAGSITCTNTVVTIDATASTSGPNITYTWTTSGSGNLSGNTNTTTPTVTGAGTYTLTVLNTINGCSSQSTVSIVSNGSLPTGVSAGTDMLLPCDSGTVILNGASTSSNISYTWFGPGGYTFAGQTPGNVETAGTYTLVVTDTITGCNFADTVSVIDQSVHASFTYDPISGVAPLLVNFTNTSTGATTYSWNFNDGNTSILTNPSNEFVNTGTYSVVLTAFNSAGTCSAVATGVITVEDPFFLEVPNVFTPNADGSNDVFTIKSKGVKEISLQIFNRWGQKMYEFSGAKAAWDGLTAQGAEVPSATYFYFIKASDFKDQVIEKQGTVNLFR
ncbi:MAG: gliding motility-associated C-terminal domain-containing protein [Bacteroidota bacterium]